MLKKFLAPVLAGGIVLGGVGAGGTAFGATTPPAATATHPHGAAGAHAKGHRKAFRRAGIRISAKTIGVTPKALVTELRSGKSIAQVAGEHGVQAVTVENALTGAAEARVMQAVKNGRLTQAQADRFDANLPARVAKLVDHVF